MKNIRGLLFPNERIFFDLLEEESRNVLKGAKILGDLGRNYGQVKLHRDKLKKVETEGDRIVSQIHHQLNTSFITPIDHEDIADMASAYDDVLDYIYSVVNRLFIYDIKKIDKTIEDLCRLVVESCTQLDLAFVSMKKLSQKEVEARAIAVHRVESEADELMDMATAHLFKKKNVIEILKFKEIYEILEGTTDRCEDVVDIYRDIVLKHS